MISFNDTRTRDFDLTSDFRSIINGINNIDPTVSGTDYNEGLCELRLAFHGEASHSESNPPSCDDVLSDPDEDISRRAIFLSDGLNNGEWNTVQIQDFIDDYLVSIGVVIDTVAVDVGSGSDAENLLSDMAERTGGLCNGSYDYDDPPQTDSEDLEQVFLDILAMHELKGAMNLIGMVIKTDDILSRQVIWYSGDDEQGIALYLYNGRLYFDTWKSSDPSWGPIVFSKEVVSGTIYNMELIYDSIGGTVACYLNGELLGVSYQAGVLDSTTMTFTLGGNTKEVLYHDGVISADNYFNGQIYEVVYYESDVVITEDDLNQIEDYFAGKYGLVVPEVVDTPPLITLATVSSGQIIDDNWDGLATVTLTADALETDGQDSLTYEWYDEQGNLLASGQSADVELGIGTHRIQLQVSDGSGLTNIREFDVVVESRASGQTAHWKFDDDLTDSISSYSGTGEGTEPLNYQWGKDNYAVVLNDTANDQWIDLSTYVGGFPGGNCGRTIMGWFEASEANKHPSFFSYGDVSTEGGRLSVTASAQRISVTVDSYVSGKKESHEWGVELPELLTGFHNLVVEVPDGAEWSDQIRIYLDGLQQTACTIDGESIKIQTNTWGSSYACIGKWEEPDDSGTQQYFSGKIDDVKLYARGLNPGDLSSYSNDASHYHVVDLGSVDGIDQSNIATIGHALNEAGDVVGTVHIYLGSGETYEIRVDTVNEFGVAQGSEITFTTGSSSSIEE